MKLIKTCIGLLIISITFSLFAIERESYTYEARLHALIENGVISEKEAKKQMVQLGSRTQNTFHKQVRGVASTIKEIKTYKIVNEPLEISAD
jgi:low affinity Fe/Cu permease